MILEIQNLRALSVLLVVGYHLGFTYLSGGFIGVGVFFVLSGYLITKQFESLQEVNANSIIFYYLRRIHRIYPAAIINLTFTLLISYFFLLPSDLNSLSNDILNFLDLTLNYDLFRSHNYFTAGSSYKPALHYWSLAVELQFYLIFPFFYLFLAVLFPNNKIFVIIFFILISIIICQILIVKYPTGIFYLTPFRFWEFLIGALAYLLSNRFNGGSTWKYSSIVKSLCYVCIITTAVFYGEITHYPGVSAVPYSIATAVLLYLSGAANVKEIPRIYRPITTLGDMSYSIYLTHWPIIVLVSYSSFPVINNVNILFTQILLTIIASIFLYLTVEKRLRANSKKGLVIIFVLACTAALAIFSKSILKYDGFPERIDSALAVKLDSAVEKEIPYRRCFEVDIDYDNADCLIGDTNTGKPPAILIYGDSHSLSLLPAIDAALRANRSAAYYSGTSACPPLLEVENDDKRGYQWGCRQHSEKTFEKISENKDLKVIILSAAWLSYLRTDGNYQLESKMLSAEGDTVFANALLYSLNTYKNQNLTPVIIGQIPRTYKGFPKLTALELKNHKNTPKKYSDNFYETRKIDEEIKTILNTSGLDYEFMSPTDSLCSGGKCIVTDGIKVFYRDQGHLNNEGALLLQADFEKLFQRQLNKLK